MAFKINISLGKEKEEIKETKTTIRPRLKLDPDKIEKLSAAHAINKKNIGREDSTFWRDSVLGQNYRLTEIVERYQSVNRMNEDWWVQGSSALGDSPNPSGSVNLSQPTKFYDQVKVSRALYGEPSLRRNDQVLSTITSLMDLKINAAIGYGFQILPKIDMAPGKGPKEQLRALQNMSMLWGDNGMKEKIDKYKFELNRIAKAQLKPTEWSDAMDLKKRFDWWARNVNSPEFLMNDKNGNGPVPDIAPGLQSVRYEMHRYIYEGLVVCRYTRDTVDTKYGKMNLPMTITYIDPLMLEPYDMDNPERDMNSSWSGNQKSTLQFGRVGWKYKKDYGGEKLENSNEVRYIIRKMFCRSGQLYPVPYLIRRDIFSIALLIHSLKNADYTLSRGIINYFFLLTGPDKELLNHGFTVDDMKEWKETLTTTFRDRLSTTMALVDLAGVKAEVVQPNVDALINQGKYAPFYRMLLDGMDMPSFDITDGSRSRQVLSPKILIAFLEWLEGWEQDYWETHFFEKEIIGQNKELQNFETPQMWMAPRSIFETVETVGIRKLLFMSGKTDWSSVARSIGMDPDAALSQRMIENEKGIDEIMKPFEIYRQGVTPSNRISRTAGTGGQGTNRQRQMVLFDDELGEEK